LSARKDANRHSGIVEVSSLTIIRSLDGRLTLTLRYSYEDKPPSFGKRIELARKMLRESVDRLESNKPTDLGFAENAVKRTCTDRLGT
jgi:hypothetical protein